MLRKQQCCRRPFQTGLSWHWRRRSLLIYFLSQSVGSLLSRLCLRKVLFLDTYFKKDWKNHIHKIIDRAFQMAPGDSTVGSTPTLLLLRLVALNILVSVVADKAFVMDFEGFCRNRFHIQARQFPDDFSIFRLNQYRQAVLSAPANVRGTVILGQIVPLTVHDRLRGVLSGLGLG